MSLEITGVSTDNSTLSNKKKHSGLSWWGKLVVAGDQYLKLTCKELIPAPPSHNTRVDISLPEYQNIETSKHQTYLFVVSAGFVDFSF